MFFINKINLFFFFFLNNIFLPSVFFIPVGAEADDDRIELLLSEVSGKDITELIASGREKFASVPSGGGAPIAMAAGAGGGGAAAPADEPKKEEKVEEKEESDEVSFNTNFHSLLLCL